MTLVVDASVVVKWLLTDRQRESDTERATLLMRSVAEGRERALQPTHWLLEVGAVLARLSPDTASDDLTMLQAMQLPIGDDPTIVETGVRLAVDLDQHLFDTIYHAVALHTSDAVLVTADDRYFAAGEKLGCIVRLADW
jgi:predicted nucleic acid-binding protein